LLWSENKKKDNKLIPLGIN